VRQINGLRIPNVKIKFPTVIQDSQQICLQTGQIVFSQVK
jgi:hypothetical protein